MTQSGDISEFTPDAKIWYYLDGSNQQNGPVDAIKLSDLLDAATINLETLVWTEGRAEWGALKDDANLYAGVYAISANKIRGNSDVVGTGNNETATLLAGTSEAASDPTDPDFEEEFEDDDGTMYVWDKVLRKYVPKKTDSSKTNVGTACQEYDVSQMTYESDEDTVPNYKELMKEAAVLDPDHVPDAEKTGATAAAAEKPTAGGKRKKSAEDIFKREEEKMKRAKEQAEKEKQWFDLKSNTSVYITNLPKDITEAMLAERFSQYGVIKPGENGQPRVKIYRDKETNEPKGDGLVTFLYEPSVQLACNLADGDHFTPLPPTSIGTAAAGPPPMKVQPAKFEMHGTKYVPRAQKTNKNKQKKVKMAEKLLDWGGFDDKQKATEVTVMLFNLFHPRDLLENPNLKTEIELDLKTEAETIGKVQRVVIYGGSVAGAAAIRFQEPGSAAACIGRMNGRFFGGKQIRAEFWDGFTNYGGKYVETEEEMQLRRDRFASELEK